MTTQEFNLHYKKLSDLYPAQWASKDKANAIAKEVSGLSVEWWEKVVNKVIAANDPFIKLQPIVEAEKRRLTMEHNSTEQAREHAEMRSKMGSTWLDKAKQEHGVEKASELIGKVKVV